MLSLTALFLQLAVAGVFLASGLSKARGTANEETWSVLAARLPLSAVRFPVRAASVAHTAVELVVGTALLAGSWARGPALAAATGLFAAFTLLALYSARAGNAVPCSCFGKTRTSLGWPHVWRNLALTCLAATGLACATAAGPGLPAPLGAVGLAVVGAVAVTAVTFYYDDLVDLFGSSAGGRPTARLPRP
ncbi:MauE/DoxX family redox-associated membrane protein [Nocardiopsis sp. NPDC050513]|uniref:MauE/DoxX family redox-associated membrane protein n=1 Tax=Nocardiopsis sp. NPDC050513 TaxID=3364338 RepID=UPI0037A79C87